MGRNATEGAYAIRGQGTKGKTVMKASFFEESLRHQTSCLLVTQMTAKKGPKSQVTAILHYLPGTTIEVTDACPKEGASKLCGQTRIEQVVFIETLTRLFYQTVSRIPFLLKEYIINKNGHKSLKSTQLSQLRVSHLQNMDNKSTFLSSYMRVK